MARCRECAKVGTILGLVLVASDWWFWSEAKIVLHSFGEIHDGVFSDFVRGDEKTSRI
jgi:hypothetical protein